MFKLILFPILLCSINVRALNIEQELRSHLFRNDRYKVENRPVVNYNDTITVSFGLEVISLEEFNQVSEKVKFNFHMKYTWYDEYLKWNKTEYNLEFINLNPEFVWRPDLELYNSANVPEKLNGEGILKLYYTGHIYWIIPVIYDYSCPLNLKDFPFDSQNCKMTFGSWKQSKNYLNISLYSLPMKNMYDMDNISVSFQPIKYDLFKHNEWEIDNIIYQTNDIEYLCCPGELWTISDINIEIKRSYHKYLVVIIMTFLLTMSALSVSYMKLEKYTRFYLLVFIPLSIIWLQLYISSKIPVIDTETRMEQFIQLSFYTAMISAIQSGIFYNLSHWYFPILEKYYKFKSSDEITIFHILQKNTFIKKDIDFGKRNYLNLPKFSLLLHLYDTNFRALQLIIYIITTIIITL